MAARIAIYDRWLHVLGGGERYVCALAQALSRRHHVTLLTHRPIARSELERHLRVDLGAVALTSVPFDPSYRAVAEASASLDLFVNGSHRDLFAGRARANALVVFFPARPEGAVPPLEYPWWLRPRRLAQRAWLVEGFSVRIRMLGRVCRWTGRSGRLRLELPHRPPRSRLRLVVGGFRPPSEPPARLRLMLDGQPMGAEWTVPRDRFAARTIPLPLLPRGRQTADLTLVCANPSSEARVGEVGVAVAEASLESGLPSPLGRLIRRRLGLGELDAPAERLAAALDSYGGLLAISRYSRHWVERLWGRESALLYPSVAVADYAPGPKRPRILSVGRFFPGQHNKKHAEMIDAFKRLVDGELSGWEYHLVGALKQSDSGHHVYLERLRQRAEGYPVLFHANASPGQVRELCAISTLYWHATGYGEDPEAEPERFEHFGVSAVEAMAAGCVPLVYGHGGPAEIVEDGTSGLLWSSLDELERASRRLIEDPDLAGRLAEGARRRSVAFSDAAFADRAESLLAPLIEGGVAAPSLVPAPPAR